MPRASLRSVLLICAFNTACMCRVSTQITGNPAGESAEQPLRQRSSFQPNSLEVVGGGSSAPPTTLQVRSPPLLPERSCLRHPLADARLLDRNVQSSKMVHAALLLLMLEAVITDLVSPSA